MTWTQTKTQKNDCYYFDSVGNKRRFGGCQCWHGFFWFDFFFVWFPFIGWLKLHRALYRVASLDRTLFNRLTINVVVVSRHKTHISKQSRQKIQRKRMRWAAKKSVYGKSLRENHLKRLNGSVHGPKTKSVLPLSFSLFSKQNPAI